MIREVETLGKRKRYHVTITAKNWTDEVYWGQLKPWLDEQLPVGDEYGVAEWGVVMPRVLWFYSSEVALLCYLRWGGSDD